MNAFVRIRFHPKDSSKGLNIRSNGQFKNKYNFIHEKIKAIKIIFRLHEYKAGCCCICNHKISDVVKRFSIFT